MLRETNYCEQFLMSLRSILLVLFIIICLPRGAAASDTLVIHQLSDLDSIPLINHAAFFEDHSGIMSWQEVMRQPFSPGKKHMFWWIDSTYGQRRVTLWFRITLQNNMPDSAQVLLLFQTYSLFRQAIVLSHVDTVIRRPNYFFTTQRKENRVNLVVAAAPGGQLTYLIQIVNPSENLGPMTLLSIQAYDDWNARAYRLRYTNYMGHIMFLAVILFISLHTLAQYFMRRRREFIWYALYSTCVFLVFLQELELQHYYDLLFSFFPYVQKYATNPLFLLVSFAYLRFARAYVDFKALAPWYYRVVTWSERLILAAVAAHLLIDIVFNNYPLAKKIFAWMRLGLFSVSFTGIFLLLRSRKKVLYFFGIGSLLLTLGLVLSTVFYYFPQANPFGRMINMRYIEIGVVLELLCFTSGLSYKSRLIEEEKQHAQQQLMVEKEKEHQLTLEFTKKIAEMELQLLKSQLNPHFYFNTLNNLYGLAMIAPKKAPDAILKLSDIMEYVIYDCRHDKVPLAKEIKFLQSYIELEKLRYDTDAHIAMNVTGSADNRSISPMLLIQFVENAFKHGIEKEKVNSFLQININVHNGTLEYESHNSINSYAGKNGGVGLTNVRKRLDLLYPQKHELQVVSGDHEFRVKLKLTL